MSSSTTDPWSTWFARDRHGGDEDSLREVLEHLAPIRARVLENASIEPGETVLDVGCGDGLIGFGALEHVGADGRVIFADISQELLDRCAEIADGDGRCSFLHASVTARMREHYKTYARPELDSMLDFTERDVVRWAEEAGFAEITFDFEVRIRPLPPFTNWPAFESSSGNPLVPPLRAAAVEALGEDDAERFLGHLRAEAEAGRGVEREGWSYLRALA